ASPSYNGQQGAPSNTVPVHFRGANIVKCFIEDLRDGFLFNPANSSSSQTPPLSPSLTDILISGSSAGGLGVMGHGWRFQTLFPTANIRAVIDSSQFFSLGGEKQMM
ncbi:unnamed protein product, partial [Amoebophrya sp. A120]